MTTTTTTTTTRKKKKSSSYGTVSENEEDADDVVVNNVDLESQIDRSIYSVEERDFERREENRNVGVQRGSGGVCRRRFL